MADNTTIKLTYRITDIQRIPNTTVHLIGIEVNQGDKMWRKAFKVDYGRPISVEEFERDLKRKNLMPEAEDDPMVYLREEIGKPHEIEIEQEIGQP